jgi:hypothetical protein
MCVRFVVVRPQRAAVRPNGPVVPPARVEGPGWDTPKNIPSGPTGRPFTKPRWRITGHTVLGDPNNVHMSRAISGQ